MGEKRKRPPRYPSEYFDRYENPAKHGGDFVSGSDDDGDHLTEAARESFRKSLIMDLASDTEDEPEGSTAERSRRTSHRPPKAKGGKVEFTDDEIDDDDNEIKSGLQQLAQLNKNRTGQKPRSAKRSNANSMVGRRERPQPRRVSVYKNGANGVRTDDEEEEDERWEPDVPIYIKERQQTFRKAQENPDHAGLMIPPDYHDIDFSDDEHLEDLPERPDLLNATPSAPYADIKLPYSLGVIPAPIAQWLRPYQVEGAQFLHECFVYQRGGILGDDMGLGKTIQVIAFLTAAFGKTGDARDAKRMRKVRRASSEKWYPRILIVCPGSLMNNWRAELDRWGWWAIELYHGAGKDHSLKSAMSGRTEILITTYETYRGKKDQLNLVQWDCVVADECHKIKGRRAEVTVAMNEVNALCRIGLTGTAIQNNYEELWTILNWTNPGRFGPLKSWKEVISEPLKRGQSHDATVAQLAVARKTAEKLVQNLLPEFFLRRLKTLVAHQLPKKTDRVVFCPLTEDQLEAYENFATSERCETIKRSTEVCDCGSKKKRGWCCFTEYNGVRWQNEVFPALNIFKKLSNHLALLIPSSSDHAEKQAKDFEWLEECLPHRAQELWTSRDSITNYANPEFFGKWKVLKKLLAFWHGNGDKVLVFSHSVRLLKMLRMLFSVSTSYSVSYLDGSLRYDERTQVVDDFNSDPQQFVFLISTLAGGVGLNITAANKVVIVDPNWNPSHDLQAQDRAYRIGQLRDVEVFRLISAGTIEEIVYARQIYKQQQANIGYTASLERRYFKGIQNSKDSKGEIFGLANLFAFHGNHVVLQDIVNKTNIAESRAGVAVVGLDLHTGNEDEEEEECLPPSDKNSQDNALSQLAELISEGRDTAGLLSKGKRGGGRPKRDPVQAILSSAGVAYSHENSEVIGTSKIETRLSRHAQEAATLVDSSQIRQHIFAASHDRRDHESIYDDDVNESDDLEDPDTQHMRTKYRPGEEVRRRQFCSMAKAFGFDGTVAGVTEFALLVESWTQAQRRAALDRFYKIRKEEARVRKAQSGAGEA